MNKITAIRKKTLVSTILVMLIVFSITSLIPVEAKSATESETTSSEVEEVPSQNEVSLQGTDSVDSSSAPTEEYASTEKQLSTTEQLTSEANATDSTASIDSSDPTVNVAGWDNAWTYTRGLGNNTYISTIYQSPQVFWNGTDWLNITYEQHENYHLLRNSHVAVEVYDYYARYYDVNYTEVRLYDERFEVQSWKPQQEKWDALGAQSGTPIYAVVANTSGVWLTKSYTSWAGMLNITYALLVACPLKTTMTWKSFLAEETEFRIVMKWSGISGNKVVTNQGVMNVTAPITFNSTIYTFMKENGAIAIQENLVDTGYFDENLVYRNYVLQPAVIDVDAQGMKCNYVFQNSSRYTIPQNGIITVDPTTSVPSEANADGHILRYSSVWEPPDQMDDYAIYNLDYLYVGQEHTYAYGYYLVLRSYVTFATCPFWGKDVLSATLKMTCHSYDSDIGPFYVYIMGGDQPIKGYTLTIDDWNCGTETLATWSTSGYPGGNQEVNFDIPTSQIFKQGYTSFEIKSNLESSPICPPEQAYVRGRIGFWSGNSANPPILEVTWIDPTVHVHGKVFHTYLSQDYNCRRVNVNLYDETDSGKDLIDTKTTNDDGYFDFGTIDNVDEKGTHLDITIQVEANIPYRVRVRDLWDNTYKWNSPREDDVDNDDFYREYVISGSYKSAHFIAQVVLNGYIFAYNYGMSGMSKVTVEWYPGSWGAGSPFLPTSGCDKYYIKIADLNGDNWDEDVINHEYGHSIHYHLTLTWFPANIPFREGWADFFGVAANFEEGFVRDTKTALDINLETDYQYQGESRTAVACSLWDIYDGAYEEGHHDGISEGANEMLGVIDWYIPDSIYEFWEDWITAGFGYKSELWDMFNEHGITHGDSVDPTVDITQPLDDTVVSGIITIKATAYDDFSGVWKVEFYRDGSYLIGTDEHSETVSITYTCTWNTATVPNGAHTIKARAYDNASNYADHTHTVTVSNGGSCPFLYAWDGTKFVLMVDVMGPGGFAYPDVSLRYDFRPPNPQDFAVIPGEMLQTVDGKYVVELAEHRSEISYIDALRLIAVDHPIGYDIYSPTVMTQIPLPFEYRTVYNPISPITATKCDYFWGYVTDPVDILDAILIPDDLNYAVGNVDEWHVIELDFGDLGDLADISEFKLIVRGWMTFTVDPVADVLWIQQHPETARAPYIEVINEYGEWEAVGEPICNESFWEGHGMPRTMMRDIRHWLKTSDYRLRLHYWGGFHLDWIAVDITDTPLSETRFTILKPTVADLYYKGGVKFIPMEGDALGYYPALPDWDIPYTYDTELFVGYFTRYGNVKPLLKRSDDMFVIINYGDSIHLEFPEVPVPPGMERHYYFFVDGYFKENYVKYFLNNTVNTVGPLPFHAMTTYPYGENESYPDDPIHRLYLRFWNTRYIGPENSTENGSLGDDYTDLKVTSEQEYIDNWKIVTGEEIKEYTNTKSLPWFMCS